MEGKEISIASKQRRRGKGGPEPLPRTEKGEWHTAKGTCVNLCLCISAVLCGGEKQSWPTQGDVDAGCIRERGWEVPLTKKKSLLIPRSRPRTRITDGGEKKKGRGKSRHPCWRKPADGKG